MRLVVLLSLAVLSSCGAGGEPIPPSGKGPGVSVTGEVSTGVVVKG